MEALEIPLLNSQRETDIPSYAYPGDAGMDLRSSIDIVLKPFERALIPTGISLAIPVGYAGFVLPRSGLAIKNGISLVNSPGLIDSNYRGEIQVIAINLDPSCSFTIHKNDRVAQLVIMRVLEAQLLESNQLEKSVRGSGGFGSSGI